MTLQDLVCERLSSGACPPRTLYSDLAHLGREGLDAALKALRRSGRVVLVCGHFQQPRALKGGRRPKAAGEKRRIHAYFGAPLTHREEEIAECAAQGETSRGTAQRLRISRKTVEAHLSNVYAKLGVEGKEELRVRMAERAGEGVAA